LSNLKGVAYDAEVLLLRLYANNSLLNSRNAEKVKETLDALEKAANEGLRLNLKESVTVHREWECRRETSSLIVESDIYGREEDKEKIVKLLLSTEVIKGGGGGGGMVSCIPIIGMGGLGKTTLAQLAYNDQKVKQHFDVKVWVFVSRHFDVKNTLITIIESITKYKWNLSTMDAAELKVRELLYKKRYLIVLDDVWIEDLQNWDTLRPVLLEAGIGGSKILITTQNKAVAHALIVTKFPTVPYYLGELCEEACWSLFKYRAFDRGEEEKHQALLPVGRQIVRKCGGVAIAAKTLGSLMRFKRELREWVFVQNSELWDLEACKSGILPALKLSYSHLPLHLKRCLSFCSLFPRNYEFKKEKLIHLWMAEGLIQSSSGHNRKEPEDIGSDYFTNLEWMSFFQETKQYESDALQGYKMHDIIYDLLQSVTSSEYTILCRGLATPTSFKQVRHSAVFSDFRSSAIPEELYQANHHLRTLLFFSDGNLKVLPEKLYSSFTCLFVLSLSGSGLMDFKCPIGSLSHLTYLDLSHTHVKELPPQLEDLRSLQTLNLFKCYNLLALPDLTKMKRLRHLNNEGCRKLTRTFKTKWNILERLPCKFQLRTLPLFVVGEGFDLTILARLKLRGSLKITHLENIKGRLCIAPLRCQRGIESLGLYWGSEDGCPNIYPEGESTVCMLQERKESESIGPSQEIQHDPSEGEELLGRLELPTTLERLLIKGYPGFRFPILDTPYVNMVDLINCRQAKGLPTLGNLQFLTSLSLRGMHGVRCIGKEFYCEGKNCPFPVLKELVIVDFPDLGEWLSPDASTNAFPNLRKLVLSKCPELTVMPHFLSLHHLDIRDCRATLLNSFQNLTSLETLAIEGIKDMRCFLGAFPISNPLLRSLEIKSCRQLSSLPEDLGDLTALKTLVIRWCGELKYLPQSLQYLSALESLEIGDCDGLTSLPEGGNRGLSNLRSLSIENCNNLSSLSMGFHCLTSLEILTIMYCPRLVEVPPSVKCLSSLQSLSIMHCPQLNYLPEELQNLTMLHSLEIRGCPGLKVLPEGVEKLVSLRSLAISDCHTITALPEGIECLTALQHLSIQNCPQLQQRCRPERGEDWPKVAHVPYKHIELPKLKRPREEGTGSSTH
ncbi:NB-ARC domain, LRR domain containing protein, partial [Parasponia andersonii]